MKMSRRNKGSVEDMIHAFQNRIDELEGSDIHSSADIGNREYRYVTKHGLGPGMMPKDVNLIRSEDLDNYKTAIYIDRPLSKEELDYYDIYPEWIQSGTQMYDEDDPVDMENEDEVRDAVAMYLSTMHIDPMKFEDVVDNYVDLIMDHGYDSIQEWWDDFNDSEEMEQLRRMGYISDDRPEWIQSGTQVYDEDDDKYTGNRYEFIVKRYNNPSEEHEVIVEKSYDDACNKLNNDEYVEWYDDYNPSVNDEYDIVTM